MSQTLEILGKGLVGSLWCIFGKSLQGYKADTKVLKIHLAERPGDPDLLLKAAVSFYREGLPEKGAEYAKQLLTNQPNSLEAKMIFACCLERLGRRDQATAVLDELHQEYKKNANILFALGFLYETMKNEDKALDYYEQTLQIAPNLINAHQRLAAIALKNEQMDDAIEHYRQLCEIDPEDVSMRTILAGLYLNNGQARKAAAEFQVALTIEPDNWEMENEMVRAYVKAGQYHEAIAVLEELLEKQGEFPDTYLQLAELYAKLGDDENALKNYQTALDIHPGYLEAMVKYGTYHIKLGRYLAAAQWFSRAIDANDRLLNAYVGLAVAQSHTGQEKKATESIELAMAVEPNTTMLFAEMARLELKASAAQAAKDYLDPCADNRTVAKQLLDIQAERFTSALEEHPDRADWHYRYGLLLKAQSKTADAVEQFKQAVEINPDYVKALVKLGLALVELGETQEAATYFERAVKLKPEYVDVHYQLGLIYSDQARYHLAVEEFEKALNRNGQHVDALAAMAQALENIGMHDQAKASWQAIVEIAPESEQAKLAKVSLS